MTTIIKTATACTDQHGRVWHLPPSFTHENVAQLMSGSGSTVESKGCILECRGKKWFTKELSK